MRDEAINPGIQEALFEDLSWMAIFDNQHSALRNNGKDWEEGRRFQCDSSVMLNRSLKIKRPVFGLCWKCPWRFVARADIDAAEEDRVESMDKSIWVCVHGCGPRRNARVSKRCAEEWIDLMDCNTYSTSIPYCCSSARCFRRYVNAM